MKKLIIVLGLLAFAALFETPDDYTWGGLDQNEPAKTSDSMYDWSSSPDTLPVAGDALYQHEGVTGEKI